jgi:DNA-binding IclR family transcriptional regulator
MIPVENQKRPVKTVEIAFELLGAIQQTDGIGLSALAEEVDLAKSTVHRHLGTLESHGFVVKQTDGYHTGLQFLNFGIDARDSRHGFDLAREKAIELADRTGELCIFMVEEHGRGYILCREEGPNAVRTGTRVGKPVDLHATAGGKAILSHQDPETVERILDAWGMPARTDNTITDRKKLFEELERIRDRGYSFNREEHINGLQTVGAPVLKNGDLVGALCISGPANRMTGDYLETEMTDLLLAAVNELELNLEYA